MSVRRRLLAAITAAAAGVILTSVSPADAVRGSHSAVDIARRAAAHPGISVRGNEVRRGNHRFTSRGVIFEGLQFPLEAMKHCVAHQSGAAAKFCRRHIDAQNYYFGNALDLARTDWHANTVRLNLGQVMLDPKSALFAMGPRNARWGQTYLARVEQAVQFAESKNMVVELALFNYRLAAADRVRVGGRSLNSYDRTSGLPTYRTNRALARLADAFAGDSDVLLEVYNEPYGNARTYVTGRNTTPKVAGVNTLTRTARAHGVTTPLIVQGPSADLSALPLGGIHDKNLIFASHPFPSAPKDDDARDWTRLFGRTATSKPVLITAWDAVARTGNWCKAHGPGLVRRFLDYVKARRIGLSGFAFDVNGTMVHNFQKHADAPTSFLPEGAPKRCASGGAGADIRKLFAAYAGT